MTAYDDMVRLRIKGERQAAYEEKVTGRAGGTPETLCKERVTMHPIDRLLADNKIDQEDAYDLWAIEWGYRLITEPVSAKLSSPYRSDPGESPEPLNAIRCQSRYKEWARSLTAKGKHWTIRVCTDLAVDGMGLREIEVARRIRHGRALEMLRDGLDYYRAAKRIHR